MRRSAVLVLVALGIACGKKPPAQEAAPAHLETAKGAVTLTPEAVKVAGIVTVPVARTTFRPHVVATGVIRPDPTRSVVVRARVAGRVVRVLADAGEQAAPGQKLATFEGPDATAVLGRATTALARASVAQKALERADRLLAAQAISRAERDSREADAAAAAAEAESARQDLARLGIDPSQPIETGRPSEVPVRSPIAGTVIERTAAPGLTVDKDAALFVVASLQQVWAIADVYEKDLGQIEKKGAVAVRSDAYPDAEFRGRLALVEPTLDETARVAHVRIVLDNSDGRLRPGLFVTVAIPTIAAPGQAIAVPVAALQKINGETAVFVEKGAGAYELRPVEAGREGEGKVEITRGLVEGDQVVIAGAFTLKSELLKGTLGGEER